MPVASRPAAVGNQVTVLLDGHDFVEVSSHLLTLTKFQHLLHQCEIRLVLCQNVAAHQGANLKTDIQFPHFPTDERGLQKQVANFDTHSSRPLPVWSGRKNLPSYVRSIRNLSEHVDIHISEALNFV